MPVPLPKDCDQIAQFAMSGENRPAYFALRALYDDEDGERNYLASLMNRGISASSQTWGIDRAAFVAYFESLATNRGGWDGEKRVASLDEDLSIACTYESDHPAPLASFEVRLASDQYDPHWIAQVRVEVLAEFLGDLARRARMFFGGSA
ncbi:DUF6228 family protein [Tundrisphaera lichenicola]|uniref:DUF6228 family protein n=1 Tax=Tundrisphaera lichenicola TaxID=2029860 RepID=UPI003EBD2227